MESNVGGTSRRGCTPIAVSSPVKCRGAPHYDEFPADIGEDCALGGQQDSLGPPGDLLRTLIAILARHQEFFQGNSLLVVD